MMEELLGSSIHTCLGPLREKSGRTRLRLWLRRQGTVERFKSYLVGKMVRAW